MLYIVLNGTKHYLSKEVVKRYNLKPGMRTPFTGYRIFEDSKDEEKVAPGDQEIHQAPEDDYSKLGQG